MTSRRTLVLALSAVLGLGLSACALPSSKRASTTTVTPTSVRTPPAGMAGTERFYNQPVVWRSCGANDCTRITVPVDYAKPDGATIQLAVLKVPARGKRLGALVVNPGGPGASGIDYAASADFIVGRPVRQAYDIVGFDPRGVARSAPVDCVTDSGLDAFFASDPTPDDPAEERQLQATARSFADSCARTAGPLLAHVSTVEAAKDMDVLRAALGEDRLNFMGKSYGTFLGATYAGLFPHLVGRMVLDGVVAPELTTAELNLGQAEGFERATRAWAASCIEEGDCPLGSTVEEVMQGMRDLMRSLDVSPLTRTGDPSVPRLTEGWGAVGVAQAMYDQGQWSTLVDAVRRAVRDRDGSGLMALAEAYARRKEGGGYTGNLQEVIYAVNCLDRPDSATLADYRAQAAAAEAKAPTWGKTLAWGSYVCTQWPVRSAAKPARITAEGSGLIVVVGTTRDPATPYEWSVRLHDELASSTLITWDGDGHTAYTRGSSCVDKPIDAYFVKGTPPPPDLHC